MNQFWLHSVGNIHVIYPKKIDKHERERKRNFFFKKKYNRGIRCTLFLRDIL